MDKPKVKACPFDYEPSHQASTKFWFKSIGYAVSWAPLERQFQEEKSDKIFEIKEF